MSTTDQTKPDLSGASVALDRARVATWVLGQLIYGELANLHVGPERDTAIWACQQWIDEATEQVGRALGETAWAPRGGWPALRGSIGKAEGGTR